MRVAGCGFELEHIRDGSQLLFLPLSLSKSNEKMFLGEGKKKERCC